MGDYTELKRLAEAHAQKDVVDPIESARVMLVEPKAVLALIAENERLEAINNQMILLECNGGTAQAAINLLDERDRLRAEVAGLRTGYEAYEQVNAELKAEVEKLRNALMECTNSLQGEMLQKFGGQLPEDMHPVTRREYDRDIAEVSGYRAALGQGGESNECS